MSRKVSELTPEMQEKAAAFAVKMAEHGIPFMFTCTYRSQEEQDVLFSQGRATPGKIVTWTRNSLHTKRIAFDIAVLRDGKPIWDVKVDVDADGLGDYYEAGEVGESVGLVWGGRWKKPDYAHFQLA